MATFRSDFAAFVKGRVSASRVLTQELGTRPPAIWTWFAVRRTVFGPLAAG